MDEGTPITLVNPNDKKILKNIGYIRNGYFKIYTTERNFYKHQYQKLQAYYFEESLIELLKSEGVSFIVINEHHRNKISEVNESKRYIFPIAILGNIGLKNIEHNNSGFDKQIGIPRELLLNFEVKMI